MKLNVVVGENFLDILDTQVGLIKHNLGFARKQLIIVPDRYALTMENSILAKLGLVSSFDIDVVSFARLSSKVLKNLESSQVLTTLGATMIIEMLLVSHERELRCFNNTAKTIAFASTIFDTISQLKSCNITPTDLKNSLKNLTNTSQILKFGDIALIYELYEKFLANHYVDANNKLDLLCKEIDEERSFENCDIHFCNFDNLTSKGWDVLKILLAQANSVSIGACCPQTSNNNREMYNTELYDGIEEITKALKIKPNIYSAKKTLTLQQNAIMENVMAIKPQTIDLDKKYLQVFSASSVTQEVDWLGLNIISKVRAGARFRDFAINCANLEYYLPYIKRVFKKYDIPFWSDVSFNLQNSEGCKVLSALFDCVDDYFEAKDIKKFVKNPLLRLDESECEIFENVLEKYDIEGASFLSSKTPDFQDEDFAVFLKVREQLAPLFTFYSNIKISHTIGEYISSVYVFIEEIGLCEVLQTFEDKFNLEGDLERSSIFRQTYQKIETILTQMRDLMGGWECSFGEFNKIWRAGVSNVTISPLPMSLDCVFIGQNLQSEYFEVDYFYVLGAVEGEMPAWVNDVGLISDSEIKAFSNSAVKIAPTIRQINIRSRFKSMHSLIFGKKELIVSYPQSKAGEDCQLAEICASLLKIFTLHNVPTETIVLSYYLNDDVAFGGQRDRLSTMWATVGDALTGVVKTRLDSSVDKIYLDSAERVLIENGCSDVLSRLKIIHNGNLNVENLNNAEQVFFTQGKAGVTQVERFFECPYKHFLMYGLKLKEKKLARIEAVDIGNILHAVIEKFGKMIIKIGVVSDEECASLVAKYFDEVLKSKEFEYFFYSNKNTAMLSNLKQEAVEVCLALNYQLKHSQYRVAYVEAKFGSENFVPVPSVKIKDTNKTIKISGKIDRADVCDDKLRIIDYKTSKYSADFKLINFYLGRKIQLFFYLNTLLAGLDKEAGGAYYLPVHKEYFIKEPSSKYARYCMQGVTLMDAANIIKQDDQLSFEHPTSDIIKVTISTSKDNKDKGNIEVNRNRGLFASREQFKNMLKYSVDVLEGAINDISSGLIKPLCLTDACTFCPYKEICRFGVLIDKTYRSSDYDVSVDTFDFEGVK